MGNVLVGDEVYDEIRAAVASDSGNFRAHISSRPHIGFNFICNVPRLLHLRLRSKVKPKQFK